MDGWILAFDDYDASDEGRREALCTLGNGTFATRGAMPETRADSVHSPGTYAAGVYNRLADDVQGVHVENESIVNLPSWLPFRLAVGDSWFDPDHDELLEHHEVLDMRAGLLTRWFRFRDPVGRVTRVDQQRLVHMADPHLAALGTTVLPENWSGVLRIRSGIDGTVQNTNVPRYRPFSSQHLETVRTGGSDGTVHLLARTSGSHLRVAVAARLRVLEPYAGIVLERSTVTGDGTVDEELLVDVVTGVPLVVEKVVALHTSRDPAVYEPLDATIEEVRHAPDLPELVATHAVAWEALWHSVGVELQDPGDDVPDDLLRNVRLGLFHLLQTTSPHTRDLDAGVPARGLHGEAYRGHVFWDELFVIPFLATHQPALARSLLLYRYRRLEQARRAAREVGCRGACFPWQSGSDGRDESQRLHLNPESGHWLEDATYRQRHVGLAVAVCAWRYVEATGDLDFLDDYAAELILEVMTFFADLASYDVARQRFVIRGVVGPDEFHTSLPGGGPGVDNNAYTNVMTAWLAGIARKVLNLLPEQRRADLLHRLGLSAFDLARWGRMSKEMFVPFHEGMIEQFEGYAGLAELDWESVRARHGDVRRLDRVLEAEGFAVNDYQVSKQADVLMLLYVLTTDEVLALCTRLGYPLGAQGLQRTMEYYLARTCHGSTLSAVVHSWVLTRSQPLLAAALLVEAVHSDVHDVQGGTTREGIHLAAMVAGADLLLRCFAGVEARLDALYVSPAWPPGLGTLTSRLRYRGHDLVLSVGATGFRLTSEDRTVSPIWVVAADGRHRLAAGEELTVGIVPARHDREGERRAPRVDAAELVDGTAGGLLAPEDPLGVGVPGPPA